LVCLSIRDDTHTYRGAGYIEALHHELNKHKPTGT